MQVTAFKKAEQGDDLIIRLFEPTGSERQVIVSLPGVPAEIDLTLGPFEIKTVRFNMASRTFSETDLLENPLTPAHEKRRKKSRH